MQFILNILFHNLIAQSTLFDQYLRQCNRLLLFKLIIKMGCVHDKQKQEQDNKNQPQIKKSDTKQSAIKNTMKSYISQVSTNDPEVMRITHECILIDLIIQGQPKQISVIYTPSKSSDLLRTKIANYFKVNSEDVQLFFGKKVVQDDYPLEHYTKKHNWIKMKVKINSVNESLDIRTNTQLKKSENQQKVQKLDQSQIQIDWEG